MRTAQRTAEPTSRDQSFGWRELQWCSTVGVIASLFAPMLLSAEVEPFLLSLAAPFIAGAFLSIRWARLATLWFGASCVFVFVPGIPVLIDTLFHPESIRDFVPLLLFGLSCVVGMVAAVPTFRSLPREGVAQPWPRRIARVVGAMLAVGVVVSVVASSRVVSDAMRSGDVSVVAEDVRFDRAKVSAAAGTVSLHINNLDATRHTFTIDALNVDVEVPAKTAKRVEIDAPAGTYRFFCRPHATTMTGRLVLQ